MTLPEKRPPVILVVDDEALLRMLAADFFTDAGYEVIEAGSGAEAVALMHERSDIRAIVTDVQMPGRPDGFALSHAIRERCPDCAIVVVSGRRYPMPGDLADRAEYLTKPYSGQRLVETVDRLLDKTSV